ATVSRRRGAPRRSSVAGGRHGSVASVPHHPMPHRAAPPRRTTVPPTPRSRLVSLTAGTAASAGLGMIPLHRLPRAVRGGYVLLPAALTTGIMLRALYRREDTDAAAQEPTRPVARGGLRLPTAQEAALSLAFGGLVAGVGAGSIALDRGVANVLRRRGVRAPRVWMGLASRALTLALALLRPCCGVRASVGRALAWHWPRVPCRSRSGWSTSGRPFRWMPRSASAEHAHFCAERSMMTRSSGKSIGLPRNSSRPAASAKSRIAAAAASACSAGAWTITSSWRKNARWARRENTGPDGAAAADSATGVQRASRSRSAAIHDSAHSAAVPCTTKFRVNRPRSRAERRAASC